MHELNFYTQLLHTEQQANPEVAEQLDEEVNILIHKLKFIPEEARPTLLILSQENEFEPVYNEQIKDISHIAGALLLADKTDNPSIICIVQDNESLYGEITALLEDSLLSRSTALQNNQLYIIQKSNFGQSTADFLADIEICAEIVQPKYFVFGRQDQDWIKFDMA